MSRMAPHHRRTDARALRPPVAIQAPFPTELYPGSAITLCPVISVGAVKQLLLRVPEDIHRRLAARAQDEVEQAALALVRRHALRVMDAWHLAVASIVVPPLLQAGEQRAFASRDEPQRAVARELGFVAI